MTTLGVGNACLRAAGQVEGELGAEDGGHAHGVSGLGEADDSVHAVVVGDGQGLEAEAGRLLDQLLGVRRTVEEAEVGVAVQFGVRHSPLPADDGGRGLVGLAMPRFWMRRAG